MHVRRRPSVDILRSGGEVTVSVGGRVVCLTPLCALLVNLAERWVAVPALVGLAVDVVDPDGVHAQTEEHVRTVETGDSARPACKGAPLEGARARARCRAVRSCANADQAPQACCGSARGRR